MFQPLRHPFCHHFILVSQERVFEFMDYDHAQYIIFFQGSFSHCVTP